MTEQTVSAPFSRRRFLQGGSALVVATWVLGGPSSGARALAGTARTKLPKPSFSAVLRRREDFVDLVFDFYNLQPANGRLVRIAPDGEALVVVRFGPQHMLEQAAAEVAGSGDLVDQLPPPVGVRLTRDRYTRLAFRVPGDIQEIELTADALLDWTTYEQVVAPTARSATLFVPPPTYAQRRLQAPSPVETAIEAPFWLVLSPSDMATWTHATTPVTAGGRTELWHTRLDGSPAFVDPFFGTAFGPSVRAVWARDFETTSSGASFAKDFDAARMSGQTPPSPSDTFTAAYPSESFHASLQPIDRAEIAIATSDWGVAGGPFPVDVDLLALSSLGAWTDVRGDWNGRKHPLLDLLEWEHRMTGGRDVYVKVVREGHIFPFGHRAVEVAITDRRAVATKGDPAIPGAYLVKKTFVVPLERTKTYPVTLPVALQQPADGRAMPFERVDILTRVGPAHQARLLGGAEKTQWFVPAYADDRPIPFLFAGVDRAGTRVTFHTPVVFVSGTVARNPGDVTTLAQVYGNLAAGDAVRPAIDLGGVRLALAASKEAGDTSVEAVSLRFGADAAPTVDDGTKEQLGVRRLPAFWPRLHDMRVRLAAAERASGSLGPPATLTYDPDFVANGWTTGEVFARLTGAPVAFANRTGGGIATPSFAADGLSRTHGTIAGADGLQANAFDPKVFYAAAGAKLLGGVDIADVLDAGPGSDVPTLSQTFVGGTPSRPDEVRVRLRARPRVVTEQGFFRSLQPGNRLELDGLFVSNLADPAASTADVTGQLRDFALAFAPPGGSEPFVALEFSRLRFASRTGAKPDMRVDFKAVRFAGVMGILEALTDHLGPLLKVADQGQVGPAVDVSPSAVRFSYSVPVPAVEIGLLLLQDLTLRAGVNLPLTGDPARVSMNLSTRENPFLVTVSALGGGGFLGLRGGADGIESLEGTLEFGGATALNLGVAKGKVQALGGLYYSYSEAEQRAVFEGFQKYAGSMRVLGMVTVSASFYMALKYVTGEDKIVGQAKLEVEIDMGLFSTGVTLKVERKFGKSGADPSFVQTFDQPAWADYCAAFAEGAA